MYGPKTNDNDIQNVSKTPAPGGRPPEPNPNYSNGSRYLAMDYEATAVGFSDHHVLCWIWFETRQFENGAQQTVWSLLDQDTIATSVCNLTICGLGKLAI